MRGKNLPPFQGCMSSTAVFPGQCGLSAHTHPGCILTPLRGFCPFRAEKIVDRALPMEYSVSDRQKIGTDEWTFLTKKLKLGRYRWNIQG